MSRYGVFITFIKPHIQSSIWLKHFRPQNKLGGKGWGAWTWMLCVIALDKACRWLRFSCHSHSHTNITWSAVLPF